MEKQKSSFPRKALIFAIFTSIAGIVGYMINKNDSLEDVTDDVKEKAKNIAKKYKKTASYIKKSIEEVFGEFSDELKKDYLEIESEILADMHDLADKKDLTSKKYENLVQETIEEFAKKRDWTRDQIKKLKDNLMKDSHDIIV